MTPGKCRICGRVRPPAELLEVRDCLTGDVFGVCRPGLFEPRACFLSIGPRDRYAIAPAVQTTPPIPTA